MKTHFIFLFCLLVLCACHSSKQEEDTCYLEPTTDYLEYPVESDAYIPLFNLYTFCEDSCEYLTFSNMWTRTLYIYDLLKEILVKRIVFQSEGPNGIGSDLFGYYMTDFNHIYIPNISQNVIYLSDTTAQIKQKILFDLTEEGDRPVPAYYTNIDDQQLVFRGDSLFVPQRLNNTFGNQMVEKSPVGIVIDTLNHQVTSLPMKHPQLISTADVRKTIEGAITYSRIYNGEDFVYSFCMDEELYKVSPDHKRIEKYKAKSRYLPKLDFKKSPDDFNQVLKLNCEFPAYGHLIYDPYREVYYRIVHLKTEFTNPREDFLKILHAGRGDFSIMILSKDFKVLGETRFPAFTYVNHIFFVREDGLYLSTSHFKRADYSDDKLCFQRLKLVWRGKQSSNK